MTNENEQQQDAEFPDNGDLAIEEGADKPAALPAPERPDRKGGAGIAWLALFAVGGVDPRLEAAISRAVSREMADFIRWNEMTHPMVICDNSATEMRASVEIYLAGCCY